ncbi:hypothetical protein N9Q43_00560 [bacterium]|nr:hypothetical protein [bacterium]
MTVNYQKKQALEICTRAAKVLGYDRYEINQKIKDVALLVVEEKRSSLFLLDDAYSNRVYRNLNKVKKEIEKL